MEIPQAISENSTRKSPASARMRLWGAALVLLAIAAFWPTISHGQIWDDSEYLTQNTLVHRWYGPGFFWFDPVGMVYQWHPMTRTVFWAQCMLLWGDWLPGYHAVNVMLHASCVMLIWRILRRLEFKAAWAAAAIFAVHPMGAETVGWIAELKNLLALLFALLSLRLSLRIAGVGEIAPRGRQGAACYALSLLAFFLSLSSKPVLCGLPIIVLVILWMKRKLTWKQAWLQVPALAIALAMGLAITYIERVNAGAGDPHLAFTPATRVMIAGTDVAFYIHKFLVPFPLLSVYPRWEPESPPMLAYVLPWVVPAVVAILFFARSRIGRAPVSGAAVILLALFPTLGFISFSTMGWSYVADHFAYVAAPAMAAMIAEPIARRAPKRIALAALAAALAVLTVLSIQQSFLYRDGVELWAHTLKYAPDNAVANMNMAGSLIQQEKRIEALPYAERAAKKDPRIALAHYYFAMCLRAAGRLQEAHQEATTAASLIPRWLQAGVIRDVIAAEIKAQQAKGPASSTTSAPSTQR